jgi:hypothetical protein
MVVLCAGGEGELLLKEQPASAANRNRAVRACRIQYILQCGTSVIYSRAGGLAFHIFGGGDARTCMVVLPGDASRQWRLHAPIFVSFTPRSYPWFGVWSLMDLLFCLLTRVR